MRVRAWAVAALVAVAATVAAAADQVVIEDWSQHRVGSTGIPAGWKGQNWGGASYDLTVVEVDGRKALHLRSKDEGTTVSKDIKGRINLRETPVLEWSWKVVTLPAGGNSCAKASDDQGAQVYVVWPRFPEAVRSRILGYVWDSSRPVGTVCKSEKTGTVTYVVVRSGGADLGRWLTERRNLADDYQKVYGESPENPGAVAIAIDSNDTHSSAEWYAGPILFRRP